MKILFPLLMVAGVFGMFALLNIVPMLGPLDTFRACWAVAIALDCAGTVIATAMTLHFMNPRA